MPKTNLTPRRRPGGFLLSAALLLVFTSFTLPATAEHEAAYSYLRVVEGDATLFQGDTGEREPAEINLPLLAGDRLWAAPGSRLEVILSDANILRLDSDTEVRFEHLAASPETEHLYTELNLTAGNIQLVVVEDALGESLPRVTTTNATIYIQRAGVYRITADREGFTQVVVRAGFAELVSERGSTIARSGEEVVVKGTEWPRSTVYQAAGLDALEYWGEALERAAAEAPEYVDEDLRYAAADLDDYGNWVDVDGRHAWRPTYYEADWRPYWNGRWRHTSTGLVWVSYEPWGWVPYHYGSWDYHSRWGWVWYPGRRFAPAHVYWYWGNGYAAWYPRGRYDHYYSSRYYGHSDYLFAIYGYGGGSWGYFNDWIFCPTGYLGTRRQSRYLERGSRLHERTGWREVPRGAVLTDTRVLGKLPGDDWRDSRRVLETLEKIPTGDGHGLRDVSPILERREGLSADMRQILEDGRLRARPEVLGQRIPERRPAPDTTLTPGRTVLRSPRDTGTVGEPTTTRRPTGTVSTPQTPRTLRSDPTAAETPRRPTTVERTTPRRPTTVERTTPRSGTTGERTPETPRTVRPSSEPPRGSTVNRGTTATPRGGSARQPTSPPRSGSSTSSGTPRGSAVRRPTTSTRSGSSTSSGTPRGSAVRRPTTSTRSGSSASRGSARKPTSSARSGSSGRSASKPSSPPKAAPKAAPKASGKRTPRTRNGGDGR